MRDGRVLREPPPSWFANERRDFPLSVRRFRVAAVSVFVVLAGLVASSAPAWALNGQVPTPTVTGPIAVTPTSYPFLATDIDLDKYGYVEEEFFVSGLGYRYDTSGGIGQTASKILTGGPNSNGTYPFNTRIVVRRPVDPADANDIVVAEWNNVTSTQDVEFNWFGDPFFLLRNGYTFVAVTAQNVGVNALKGFDRPRYRDLTVTGNDTVPTGEGLDRDALSYDVFSSVVKALKGMAGDGSVDPLGGITAEKVIASGESQSCGRLATHYNKIEPIHDAIDGYLLTVCGSQLRTDRPDDKAVRVLSELENQIQRPEETYPDTDSIRHWEVAAGSHLPRMAWDNLDDLLNRDFTPLTVECEKFPLSLVEWPFTVNRAIDGLSEWIGGGEAPPIAPRGQYVANPAFDPGLPVSNSNLSVILDRDQYGIAKGGIRFPAVTVPTATNTGINRQAEGAESAFSLFCGLLGSSTAFTQPSLGSLYRDHADYVARYSRAADQFLSTGFILAEDVSRLKRNAREFPSLRPARPSFRGKGKSLEMAWIGTEAPATKFTVQRAKPQGKQKWAAVKVKITGGKMASLAREPKGVWVYRVRSSTVIPANNISPPQTITTPFSEPSKPVKIRK
jgi:hypothetical protein